MTRSRSIADARAASAGDAMLRPCPSQREVAEGRNCRRTCNRRPIRAHRVLPSIQCCRRCPTPRDLRWPQARRVANPARCRSSGSRRAACPGKERGLAHVQIEAPPGLPPAPIAPRCSHSIPNSTARLSSEAEAAPLTPTPAHRLCNRRPWLRNPSPKKNIADFSER